jgi:NDP-sugar pyrophosphorylase family protein
MQAIILAGGRGRRLLPYTTVLPKPLMPIGDYSILEVILHQLKYFGFNDITISTGYLHELICAYLNNKKNTGLDIKFVHEDEPLGTIGPLHLVPHLDETFLVMNGDILTDLNYKELFAAHHRKKAIATIATYSRDVNIDFGVLEHDPELRIHTFREKPIYHFEVSMGIYILNKEILKFVPENTAYGFDQLMYALTKNKAEVYSFPYKGYWLDIGRPDDYERSIQEFEQNKEKFLK